MGHLVARQDRVPLQGDETEVAEAAKGLDRLWAWAIDLAATTFPRSTGVGADNMAPRAVSRLSEAAKGSLASILMACERLGSWCSERLVNLIVLLPKSSGGLRPIGLLPLEVRIWGRARTAVARTWEAANALPCVFGGVGMGAQKAAWLAAFRAEAARHGSEAYIQALLDLTKAFEAIPHQALVDAARKRGYNIAVLQLSLSAYTLPRTVGIDGVYSELLVATRGIVAGSGFATSELRLLMMDVITPVLERWGDAVDLTLYVDDLTVATSGDPAEAARRCAAVVDMITHKLEKDLELVVSTKKSVVTASSVRLAAEVARQVAGNKLKPVRRAKLLGTASTAGRARCALGLKARVKAFAAEKSRYQRLRRVGVDTACMAQAAAAPAMLYGVECCGISDSLLHSSRVAAATAASGESGGKNPDRVLYAADSSTGTIDPAFPAHVLPMKAWAYAWWQTWLPHEELENEHWRAKLALDEGAAHRWAKVCGPAAAVVVTAERLGWQWISGAVLRDDLGRTWDCTADSPAAIVSSAESRLPCGDGALGGSWPACPTSCHAPATPAMRTTARSPSTLLASLAA